MLSPMNLLATSLLIYFEGLLSFFNPCVLAIVPTYIAIVFGKKRILRKSIFFSLGFISFFVFMGFLTGVANSFTFFLNNVFFQILQGIFLFCLGFVFIFMSAFEKPIILLEVKIQRLLTPFQTKISKFATPKENHITIFPLVGSFLMGVIAALAMTPCSGPILGSVFAMVINHEGIVTPMLLFSLYALGMLTPFLIFSLFWKKLSKRMQQLKNIFSYTYKIIGVLIVFYGTYIIYSAAKIL